MERMPTVGSIWRKWDLHVHTPASILNNHFPSVDGKPDWEVYVQALESADLPVIGVTDYFTIEGYKKIREYQAKGRLKNTTILPNVELRLEQVLSSRRDSNPRRLNFHVIFSDDISPELIEEHFLHDLTFCYEGNPQDKDEHRKLKLSNLEQLGRELQKSQENFKGLTPLEVGVMTAVVDHKQVAQLLADDKRFRDKYVIVLPSELSSLIDWDGQDHNVRKTILQKSDLVFASNPKDIAWCLGEPPYKPNPKAFIDEFQSLKPCIHGSDAHDLASIGKPCAKRGQAGHVCAVDAECDMRYCWIKADPTFEGLRQLLYEPKARVRIQSTDPEPPRSNFTLRRIEIQSATVNEDLSIAQTGLDLNPGLVAIVGGRGGGKTALVDMIANCYEDRVEREDQNSFVARIAEDDPEFDVTLTFGTGKSFTKGVVEDKYYSESELVYIAQGALERYVSAGSDLAAHIEQLIRESPVIRDTVLAHELEAAVRAFSRSIKKLRTKVQAVADLEAAVTTSITEAASTAVVRKKADIADLGKKVEASKAKLSTERLKEAEAKQGELAALREKMGAVRSLNELLEELSGFLDSAESAVNPLITRINTQLELYGHAERLPEAKYVAREQLRSLEPKIAKDALSLAGNFEAKSKALAGLTADVEEHTRALDLEGKAVAELKQLEAALGEITRVQDQVAAARQDRRQAYRRVLEAVLANRANYVRVIEAFGHSKADILTDLEFSVEVLFDQDDFLVRASEVLDNRRVTVQAGEGKPSEFAGLLLALRKVITDGTDAAKDAVLDELERLSEDLKEKLKAGKTVTTENLYAMLFRNYFSVVPRVKYMRTPLTKLSLFQKATVLIKIHLAQGDKPIIIDSHDDHLDNEFIMDQLVKAIRQAKEFRQVILVSNNGNVVVNSDAEQVVLAERPDGTITYRAGSLENPSIRETLLRVLEGGEEAFSLRQKKYRIDS